MKNLLVLCVLAGLGFAEKASDSVTITTTPPGATVSWNRRVIGVTPLTYKVGEYAFNARKISLYSKRLSQPVNLHVALEGFQNLDVTITKPYLWRSFNGKTAFQYFIIELQNFDFKLDKVSAAPKVLTNADVMELWSAEFGEALIIDKINGSATAFKLEISDMLELRKAGVSDAVIQAMMQKSTR
jgi:hypothetical protein